jgi:hypothetical protein
LLQFLSQTQLASHQKILRRRYSLMEDQTSIEDTQPIVETDMATFQSNQDPSHELHKRHPLFQGLDEDSLDD